MQLRELRYLRKLLQRVCERHVYTPDDLLYVSHWRELTVAAVCNGSVCITVGLRPTGLMCSSQMSTS